MGGWYATKKLRDKQIGMNTLKRFAGCAIVAMAIAATGCEPAAEKNTAASNDATPQIAGEMRSVMREGKLGPVVAIDTISNAAHLYGLGPVEYLAGEIMVVDGRGYVSAVKDDTIAVRETLNIKAPFFGYARIERWKEMDIPDTIASLGQLETFLTENTIAERRPFFFKVSAVVDSATIHVMSLPSGARIASPQEAHALGRKEFQVLNKKAELLGFFSTTHQATFTHHNTFVHIHLLTEDRKAMGHLDALAMQKGTTRLYLPQQ